MSLVVSCGTEFAAVKDRPNCAWLKTASEKKKCPCFVCLTACCQWERSLELRAVTTLFVVAERGYHAREVDSVSGDV